LRFRDLASVGHLLEGDVNEMISNFERELEAHGWSRQSIIEMEAIAVSKTPYEAYLPHIRSKGSYSDYLSNAYRKK